MYKKISLLILGTFFTSIFVLNECRKIDGYKFPVYSTAHCPRNETEWNERSSALNCTESNGYTCLPNHIFTELLEFCYTEPLIWIQKGFCLFLVKRVSKVQSYDCSHFVDGCHNSSYASNKIFKYPACVTIGNGCFLAESFCKSATTMYLQETTTYMQTRNYTVNEKNDWVWIMSLAVAGVVVFIIVSFSMLYFYRQKTKEFERSEIEVSVKYDGFKEQECFKIAISSTFLKKSRAANQNIVIQRQKSKESWNYSGEDQHYNEGLKHKDQQLSHVESIRPLPSDGVDIKLPDEDRASHLYKDCEKGYDDIEHLLLDKGADDIDRKNKHFLFIACQIGNNTMVKYLLRKGTDVNTCMEDGASPLYIGCQNGHYSAVKLLLEKGANLNMCTEGGASPLYIACQNGHCSIVQLLISKGADINLSKKDGTSPLCVACFDGYDNIVNLLLLKNADVNLCRIDGAGPLFIACLTGQDETVKHLLKYKASIDLCEEDGASPLSVACQNGHDDIVELLLEKEANINLCERNGASPLYNACQNGHCSTVQLLLSNKADINLCMKDGDSPLHGACYYGHTDIVRLLVDKDVEINSKNKGGLSPLFIAFSGRHYKTAQILLNRGANASLTLNYEFEVNPALIDCVDKYDSTAQFLRRKENVLSNIYDPDSFISLVVFCQEERALRITIEDFYL